MNTHSLLIGTTPLTGKGRWTLHLAALGVVLCAILFMFRYEVLIAVPVWWIYPAYSHCFLIIPISAWLIWEKRHVLAQLAPSVAPKALFAVPPILLVWLVGVFATINEVRQFALIALIDVAIFAMVGPRVFRVIAFPVGYLFFLVPFGQYFIPPMQEFTTWFSDGGLSLLGVPHFTEGFIIELPNGSFEIAEACAGLRFLIATVALGALFVHLVYRKWWKIGAFLVACVAVPLIANAFRCLGIMALAYFTNDFVTVAENHITAGHIFNFSILFLMFVIGLKFRDPQPEQARAVMPEIGKDRRQTVFAAAAATVLLIAAGPAFAYWRQQGPVEVDAASIAFPPVNAGWTVGPPSGLWRPLHGGADKELLAGLTSGTADGPPVDVAIEYYVRIREQASLIASTNNLWDGAVWRPLQSGAAGARLGSRPVQFSENVIWSVSERRLVWSTYWMDDRFTTSALKVKLLELKTSFFGRQDAALIALSTPIDGPVEEARARLSSAAAALGELPKQLSASGPAGASVGSAD